MYLLRLDDASEYMNTPAWDRIEMLCDKYSIRPIVGIIPNNADPSMRGIYPFNDVFWETALRWQKKKWCIGLHGYDHVYMTKEGGINPVNYRSEFAGVPLIVQKDKIRAGIEIFDAHGIRPTLFFAPAHTYDSKTLIALKEESDIRVISDTIANDVYYYNEFFFIPVQIGKARKLPFKVVTCCYHPSTMNEKSFAEFEQFLENFSSKFVDIDSIIFNKRSLNLYDRMLRKIYFTGRRIRAAIQKKPV